MNLSFLTKNIKTKNWLLSKVGYYSRGTYHLVNGQFVASKSNDVSCYIVSKQHYSVSWQSFSSISKKELTLILKNKKDKFKASIYEPVKNTSIDGYDIKETKFDESMIESLGDNKVYIPETSLFGSVGSAKVFQLGTPNGVLYHGGQTHRWQSSYQKGLIRDIDGFLLSSGISPDTELVSVKETDYANKLIERLSVMPLDTLKSCTLYNVNNWFKASELHMLYWAPLLTALCFFVFTNSYLYIKTSIVESTIAQEKAELGPLFDTRNKVLALANSLDSIQSEISKTSNTHGHWAVTDTLLNAGMVISRLTFDGESLVVRGTADNASEVLNNVADFPSVSKAEFRGPVRKSRGRDSFSLVLQIEGAR